MKNFILFYLLICSSIIFGQSVRDSNRTGFLNPMQYDGIYLAISPKDNSYDGTTYLFPNWDGKYQIYATENKGYSIPNLNYNVKTNMLETKISKDSVFQFDVEKINFIKLGSKKYIFYPILENRKLFQEIYVSNNVMFLKGFKVVVVNGIVNPLTHEHIQKDRYSINEKYYLKLNNSKFIEMKLNKKSVLKLMGDKAFLVEKFTSDLKLGFNSEIDLVRIFQYYDTL